MTPAADLPPDPALFAPLSDTENHLLAAKLRCGRFAQAQIWPAERGLCCDITGLVNDLDRALDRARTAH